MPTTSSASAAFLVLVAASAIFAAADQPVMFTEWLSAQKSGNARPAEYGAEAETMHACLRAIAIENCQTLDSCAACPNQPIIYAETELGCCHNHGYGYDQPKSFFKDVKQANIGSCWWQLSPFDQTPASTDSTVIGTFDVTCELKGEAEKCGEVFCDGMVLKGWGKMHGVNGVAIEGRPTVQIAGSCRPLLVEPSRWFPEVAKTPAAEAPAAKSGDKAGVQNAEYHSSNVEYFLGIAVVLSGHVSTYSCSHDLKVQEGRLQTVLSYYIPSPEPIVPSPGQFILRPYEINMKLKKGGSY